MIVGDAFRAFIAARLGCEPPARIEPGRFVRFATNGKRDDDAGYCKLFPDGEGGIVGDFRSGASFTWQTNRGRPRSEAEQRSFRERIERERREAEALRQEGERRAAERAREIWSKAQPAPANHAYLTKKRVQPHGLRLYRGPLAIAGMRCDGALLVPVQNAAGEIVNLQFIAPSGDKRFLRGGGKAGCYFIIGEPDSAIAIAEGFATGASVHEATGHAVAIAFDAANIAPVTRALREKFPAARIIVCADDDYRKQGNSGLTKAREAARAVGALLAIPDFGANRPEGATDFNDMARERGADAVARAIREARPAGETEHKETEAHDERAQCEDGPRKGTEPTTKAAQPKPSGGENGAALLAEVRAFLARFVAFPSAECLTAATLWVAHAHMVSHFHTTPRLALLSPETHSGKTRVLEVLALLVPDAMLCLSPSPAAIFRVLDLKQITLLADECDAIFSKRGKDDANEDLRALLNAGYKRGATIPRCVGPRHEVSMFPVFCATALAGLGDLPETLMSRAVVVRMRRRSPGERVESFRTRLHEPEGWKLRDRLAAWAHIVSEQAGKAWPALPPGVVDRSAEVWEPLLAVADVAGGSWPSEARAACVELCKALIENRASLGTRLLADLRTIFGDAEALATATIIARLKDGERYGLEADAPWSELRGKPITDRALASILKRYGVKAVKVKIDGQALQGYRREHLWDPWTRYLPPMSANAERVEPAEPVAAVGEVPEVPLLRGSESVAEEEAIR